MNIFDWLKSLFLKKEKEDPENYDYLYNYTYFPPIPLVDEFPGTGLQFGWAMRVAIVQFRVTLNLLAIVLREDQPALMKELDEVEAACDDHRPLKTLAELVDFMKKLCDKRPDILKDFLDPFKDIVLKMEGKRGFFGALKLFFAAGNQLEQKDNNLALDFWMLFEAMQNAVLEKVEDTKLQSFEEYEALFRHLDLPSIAKTWQEDDTFAYLRVGGPNPETLTRLDAPLAKFPVTEDMYQQVMGSDDSLADALETGRVFVVDYAIFDGVLCGTYPGPQKYMGAPIGLFAVPKEGQTRHLKVVALQCGQDPKRFPIFTPPKDPNESSAARKWLMAKTWFQVSDGNFHEAVAHLGRTHLLISPFDIATRNILGSGHPIGKLLMPHFHATFNINNAAQASLIAPEGVIDQIMGGTIEMSRVYGAIGTHTYALNFDKSFQPQTFKDRGVDNESTLPYYPYRTCSLAIWGAIEEWVASYVHQHYPAEGDLLKDQKLQAWYQNLVSHDGGRIGNFGEDGALRTRSYLIQSLTMIVFTASAGHSAVNFPQLEVMSYPPAMPLAAYAPPPEAEGETSHEDLMAMFPPLAQSVVQINTGTLLGGVYYTKLGELPDDYYSGKDAEIFSKFQERLEDLRAEFLERFPEYPYLLPGNIPASINI